MIGQGKISKMKEPYKDASVLDELITRVLCDTASLGGRADAAYLFAETRDNEASVLGAAESLWFCGHVKRIFIINHKADLGFSGFDSWKMKLMKAGVQKKCIIGIPWASDLHPSTDAEAESLVHFISEHDLYKLYIIAHPIHQLRAFISCVSAAKRGKSGAHLFNYVGLPQRWEKHIIHSQGVQRGTRSALIRKELEKIIRYHKKGDLVSPRDVLKYMNQRDI